MFKKFRNDGLFLLVAFLWFFVLLFLGLCVLGAQSEITIQPDCSPDDPAITECQLKEYVIRLEERMRLIEVAPYYLEGRIQKLEERVRILEEGK